MPHRHRLAQEVEPLSDDDPCGGKVAPNAEAASVRGRRERTLALEPQLGSSSPMVASRTAR